MIRNLVFDFGKVLVDYDFMFIISQFSKDTDKIARFAEIATSHWFIDGLDREAIPFDETIRQMQQRYPEFAHEFQLFSDRYADFAFSEVPGMRETLTELKARGFKLYGLTNWCSKLYIVMDRFKDIFSLLDGSVVSSEEKVIKPEPAIYNRLFEKFSLVPSECVFTDDKPVNVEGAIAAGMQGIVFQNAVQYRSDLEKLLLP